MVLGRREATLDKISRPKCKVPFTPSVDASNQTNVKDSKHSHRPRRRASSNLHTSNERCHFKLYMLLDF